MENRTTVTINLDSIRKDLLFHIDERRPNTLFEVSTDHSAEPAVHLVEGSFYDYQFSDKECFFEANELILPHSRNNHLGTIQTNIYVGVLTLSVKIGHQVLGQITLEIRSVKADYESDYRSMLNYITEKCADLVLQANSPVSQYLTIDPKEDYKTLYQKFAFVNSLISSDHFLEAVHRIISFPTTQWSSSSQLKQTASVGRLSNKNIKEIIHRKDRSKLPSGHTLHNIGISSIPNRIESHHKCEIIDTHENRFIKFALLTFLNFSEEIEKLSAAGSRLQKEAKSLNNRLQSFLNHTFFKKVSRPTYLKINSPKLQRKGGYREVFKTWLTFEFAAKLSWSAGDDVYDGGKKNVAALYEYWVFFKLLDLVKEVFSIESRSIQKLITKSKDQLHLELKRGSHIALLGTFKDGAVPLRVRFSYNRSFSGSKVYPAAGSWTTTMQPDYTLSIWPEEFSEPASELNETIVHIHFDAKYKVKDFAQLLAYKSDYHMKKEKEEMDEGVYKNADLLKMHAYKDAIRRTGGAYILYPGDISRGLRGFHEIIPGLGAFPLSPSSMANDLGHLRKFLVDLLNHFQEKQSDRLEMAEATYRIHRKK